MARWVKLCSEAQVPEDGNVAELSAENLAICLAHSEGQLSALANWCPHRNGPLGQGWIEDKAVVCPWHAWAFDLQTGEAKPPERANVRVYKTRQQDGFVEIDLD